ncbi:MAG: hypothetical protein QOD75_2690 [Blastocatellia bacterium]|jgi:hypothetical protein|nr:hypothetical protein [Blastocatellia bacterium]
MIIQLGPSGSKSSAKLKNLGEVFLGVLVAGAILGSVSCRKSPPITPERQLTLDVQSAVIKIQQADVLYDQRDDLSKVREGLTLLRQAQLEDSGSYEVAWRLSKFDYYLGAHTTDEDERYKAYREGIEAGRRAVSFQSGKPEGHFWLGANLGGNAQANTLAGLTDIEDIRLEMEAVLKIDEGFQGGSAYLGLGQVYLQAPRLLGGDVSKAIQLLEKGKRVGPTNAMMRLRLAEAYHAAKRDADARRELNELFSLPAAKGFEPEYKEAVSEGHKLLEQLH